MASARDTFAGGVAVITGAAGGIGAGLARHAGALGMTVVVTDIAEEKAEGVAADIRAAGGKADVLKADVSQPAELDRLAETVFARHGAVRLLINNAGIETIGNSWEIPAARWEATLNINLHGIIHGVRAFAPRMIAAGKESWIANLGSIGSFGIMPTHTAYMVTKHAIQSFSECLYLEMKNAGHPIHISSILPGLVATDIFTAAEEKGEDSATRRRRETMVHMLAQGMTPLDAARVVFEQLADGKFWVSTQPEMTKAATLARARYLEAMEPPALTDETRALL